MNFAGITFADCVINNKKPFTDAKTALEGLRVVWKMYEAEKTGVVADFSDIEFDKCNF